MKQKTLLVLISILILSVSSYSAPAKISFDSYHSPAELNKALQEFASANPKFTKLHKLATSPGKHPVSLLEIGPETGKMKKSLPAVFVAANMEGTVPISSEAALYLIKMILEKPEVRKDKTWYVLACGNPDAAAAYFANPLQMDTRNSRPHNDDMDDSTDEDGTDDLDGNGIITSMRVKDPQGEWIPVPGDLRLMKKADPVKGEKGIYKLFSEGLDNDKDGKYNEDGSGGVNIGINFPHLFKSHTKTGGDWAGSEEESYYLIKFINEHREIGLTFCFGATNFCLTPPRGGRQGSLDMDKLKIPERFGEALGIDTSRTYTMKEIMEMMEPFVPSGMELTEAMISSFLGLGAVVNPLPEDLKFYEELSENYKEYLKKNKLDEKRQETARAKDGSFELWAYYHMGLPSFSLDFWTLPELKEEKKEEEAITPDKLEKMSNDEFIALGDEKIQAFLKSSGAPPNFKAKQVIEAVKGGMMTPKKMAEMLRQMPKPKSKEGGDPKEKALLAFSDEKLEGKGFVEWKPFKHPTLKDVEIGGIVPFAANTPPAEMAESLLKVQVPWVFEIAGKMARINIAKTEVKSLGSGLYRVKAWVENSGYLPYPTAMGKKNNRILPVIITLEGQNIKIIEGKKRSLVKSIGGHKSQEVTWLILAKKPVKVNIRAKTAIAWADARTIDLGGSR
jgi:hypothetical protein